MTNYRIYRVDSVTSGSTLNNINSGTPSLVPTGSTGQKLDRVWGVIKDHDWALGGITMAGGGGLSGSHMTAGTIYPCYPVSITVSTGSFSLLS